MNKLLTNVKFFLIFYEKTIDKYKFTMYTVSHIAEGRGKIMNVDYNERKWTLKALRVNLGLNVKEASAKLGIKPRLLYRYESAKQLPTVPIIKKIEQLYKISFDRINFLL